MNPLHLCQDLFKSGNGYFNCEARQEFVKEYGWAVPSLPALRAIVDFVDKDAVLEIGAGLGFWASLLQARGVSVVPTDVGPSERWPQTRPPWTTVHKLSAKAALDQYACGVLMMVWPYMDNMAIDAVTQFVGDKLIYVGETEGGCTANDAFFDLLNREWDEQHNVDIPQWRGIHDRMLLLTRK